MVLVLDQRNFEYEYEYRLMAEYDYENKDFKALRLLTVVALSEKCRKIKTKRLKRW